MESRKLKKNKNFELEKKLLEKMKIDNLVKKSLFKKFVIFSVLVVLSYQNSDDECLKTLTRTLDENVVYEQIVKCVAAKDTQKITFG